MPELCQERASGGASRMTAARTETAARRLSSSASMPSSAPRSPFIGMRRVARLARCAAYMDCALIMWRSVVSQFHSRSGIGAAQSRVASGVRKSNTMSRVVTTSPTSITSAIWLRDGADDLCAQAGKCRQVRAALGLEPIHERPALVGATLPLVELARLEDLRVVDTRKRHRDLVSEVRIPLPLDGAFGDGLHDCARVRDGYLLAALIVVGAADASGVEQVDLEVAAVHELQESIPLLLMS